MICQKKSTKNLFFSYLCCTKTGKRVEYQVETPSTTASLKLFFSCDIMIIPCKEIAINEY